MERSEVSALVGPAACRCNNKSTGEEPRIGEAMAADGGDFVDSVLAEMQQVSGLVPVAGPGTDDIVINGLVEIGMLDAPAAMKLTTITDLGMKRKVLEAMLAKISTGVGAGLPSPPFARSARLTERRAPLGFVEDGTGALFFSLAAIVGSQTTMRGKVSRVAHPDRLLIVPSAPGVVIQSIKVGDDEQLLQAGAPVELYSSDALTDSKPDNFSPVSPALDFTVVLVNTTAVAITGTIGVKADCQR